MKILVTGAKGQLASEISSVLKKGKTDIGYIDKLYSNAEVKYLGRNELDIARFSDVLNCVEDFRPDVIINCAAYTNVDGCEENFDSAFKVNSIGPRNLARSASITGARLIHVSTDYVFDGKGSVPFREYDVPKPMSVYGRTKLLGEQYIRENCRKYFIVRTSWLYGVYGKNFVYTILKAAREKGHLDVVDDQRGNPTNAEDLAYHILKIALTNEYGIYHCTGKGECSWYDFAGKIVDYAGIDCSVSPITSDKLERAAKRPEYSSLDNMMLRCTIGDDMRPWKDALKSFIEKI
ncbi:MAG: dTDP-4-dehydrorhamnose reductase [Clostridium sp.]|jgi:dTDP-4-dehydrorhamnose reductase|uniref:dTDP-4-dehydrorhamnose reductase n=1 Tax=Clostridium sp. TaxID=1506 RepID=UPI0025C19B18|nr:dTDP-4-dehydrorhamnose reductase [Clostridium sp.]MCH3965035.1 dTDP-4-dehydrorhamnose reductase [Clostridium sp.]MCI1714256.1 dTDP-4-dehydrorhamnose reductase [Clostridium sp.]MCI1798518.1 dTDP-4-dehydrorhamnose reductase [Clostridium sp.]MCI1812751.1 dTDP-4-dehydrorhamnose reductase [Clostridium sp.]MCI1869327.1 dTDP-4-dehydrorhamnose reductase [Clostridium sp.]